MSARLNATFAALKAQNRPALVTYLCGGDPDLETSLALLKALPEAGADVLEIGMPFSDPMADGPSIQAGNLRALAAGATLSGVLELAARVRADHPETPIVLMGYFNPIHNFGVKRFLDEAEAAGVDGVICVDTPPEEDASLRDPMEGRDLAFVRLATPTSDEARLDRLLARASGFLYYVSLTGVTGSAALDATEVAAAVGRIKAKTNLPVCVGFGVRTADHARAIGEVADGVVVGSALVDLVAEHGGAAVEPLKTKVAELARGLDEARPS